MDDKDTQPDYFELMKQSAVYKATVRILSQDEEISEQEAEKNAVFSANSIYCFYFLKDHCRGGITGDPELVDCITRAMMVEDEEHPPDLVALLESKVEDLKKYEVSDYVIAGVYQFIAEQLEGYDDLKTDRLLFTSEAFKLWPDNDNLYDQLSLFCSTILKQSRFVGEECAEAEIARNLKDLLSEKRPGRFIEDTFEVLKGGLEGLKRMEESREDEGLDDEPDDEELDEPDFGERPVMQSWAPEDLASWEPDNDHEDDDEPVMQ